MINAIIDSRLRSSHANRDEYSLTFIVEQTSAGFSAVSFVVFHHRVGVCMTCRVKTRRYLQKRKYIDYRNDARGAPTTEARSQATCTRRLVKFVRVVFELCERRDSHIHHNTSHPSWGRSN